MSMIQPSQIAQTLAKTFYDVVIYKANWLGINAAATAARLGMRVALIEPTGHIGGHVAQAGVNLLDVVYTNQLGGLAWQQIQQMAALGGVAVAGAPSLINRSTLTTGQPNTFSSAYVNPAARTVEAVLRKTIVDSGVDLYMNAPLATTGGVLTGSVVMAGTVIQQLQLSVGTISGAMFADASYEGDIMALSGVSYTVGRESSSTLTPTITAGYNAAAGLGYGESLAGVQASATSGATPNTVTYGSANFVPGGVPLFPIIADPGTAVGAGDALVQNYSYRSKVVLNTSGFATAFTAPPGYLASDYAAVDLIANVIGAGCLLSNIVSLTPLLNGQIDVNAANAVSNDLANGSAAYPESTPSQRLIIAGLHKKWCMGLLYWAANDTTNSSLKTNAALYGYDNREWTDNGNFPRHMYVREARRMIGQYVMTQADFYLSGQANKSDAICKTSYDIDCHGPGVFPVGTNAIIRNGDLFISSPNGPVQFPMRSILPNAAQVTNLVVLGTPSVSHIAWCPTRLEPFLAQMSEAGGIVLALAKNAATSVQSVAYSSVLTQLNNFGALVT